MIFAQSRFKLTRIIAIFAAVTLAMVSLTGCKWRVNVYNDQVVRWNSCGPIAVYINPGQANPSDVYLAGMVIAKVRDTSGIPLYYAGATRTIPTTANNRGYAGAPGNRIVFAFAEPGQTNLIAPGDFGYGGTWFDGNARIYYGYAVINRHKLPAGNQARLTAFMHELGHTVGLEHPDEYGSVMNHVPARWDGNWAPPDVEGLRFVGAARTC